MGKESSRLKTNNCIHETLTKTDFENRIIDKGKFLSYTLPSMRIVVSHYLTVYNLICELQIP
jgi:hypothetical protein